MLTCILRCPSPTPSLPSTPSLSWPTTMTLHGRALYLKGLEHPMSTSLSSPPPPPRRRAEVALERKVGVGAVGGAGGVEGAAVGGGEARACRRELYRAFTSVQDRCEIVNQYHGILLDGKHCDMYSVLVRTLGDLPRRSIERNILRSSGRSTVIVPLRHLNLKGCATVLL